MQKWLCPRRHARELVVLVGSKRAIGMAVKNDKIAQRHTRLAERLSVA